MGDSASSRKLLDREEQIIATLITKFKNIVDLTPDQDDIKDAPFQRLSAAEQVYEIELRTTELIKAAEDLLSLSRELKELWSQGPIRKLNEGDDEENLDSDARHVGSIVERIMNSQSIRQG